jgi:deoxycytidine triphosphate deaminase
MVFLKNELSNISLEGRFYKIPLDDVHERIARNPFRGDDDLDDSSVQHAMPSSIEISERTSVADMREKQRLLGLSRDRINKARLDKRHLMPDLSGVSQAALPSLRNVSRRKDDVKEKGSYIYLEPRPDEDQVGVCGFDLRTGLFIGHSDTLKTWDHLPFVSESVLREMPHKLLDFGEEHVLKYDSSGRNFYYITSYEGVLLSEDLEIIIDSKSTTGRVGCISHFGGFTEDGKIITIVQPYSFNLKIRGGKTKLSQAVVRYRGSPYLANGEVLSSKEVKLTGENIDLKSSLVPKGLSMKFNTLRDYYRAFDMKRRSDEPIDMDANGVLKWEDYFEKIEGSKLIKADMQTLHLLGSMGVLDIGAVCGILSREEEVMTGTGAWGHFAGVFRPFWKGEITMEFYSQTKVEIPNGKRAGVVVFDPLVGDYKRPKENEGSYFDQRAPTLPRMFKKD